MPATWIATRELPIASLTRFPGNARRGNVAEIRKSLMRHGQYRAVVVRDDDGKLTVLAGNHTTAALESLAVEPPTLAQLLNLVPADVRDKHEPTARALLDQITRKVARCEIIQCTDDEARRIALADNRLSDLATDDPDALTELLQSLDGDFDGTGWTEEDLDALLEDSDGGLPGGGEGDPDDAPEPP